MFKAETMSRVSLIFLKRDLDRVIDFLSKKGVLHIVRVGGEDKQGQALALRAQDLYDRVCRTASELNLGGLQRSSAASLEIKSSSWEGLLNEAEALFADVERKVRECTDAVKSVEPELKEAEALLSRLAAFKQLGLNPRLFEKFKLLYVALLSVPLRQVDVLVSALPKPAALKAIAVQGQSALVLVASPSRLKQDVVNVVRGLEITPLSLPPELPEDLGEAYSITEARQEELLAKLSKAKGLLEEIKQKQGPLILSLRDLMRDVISVFSVRQSAMLSERWVRLEGYAPSYEVEGLVEELKRLVNGKVIVFSKEEHSSSDVPVLFKYPSLIKPFEMITALFGYPSYTEVNPTPVLAITFPLIFGLMFGDLGHGLVLFIAGLFVYKRVADVALKSLGLIVSMCGLFAIFFGALFGEAFGLPLMRPILFSPIHNIMGMLKLSIVVGVVHILSGLVLKMVNGYRSRNFVDLALVDAPKLAMYLAGVYLVFAFGIDLNAWMSGPIAALLAPVFVLMLGKALATAALRKGEHSLVSVVAEYGFESFDSLIRFLSNTVSYARIFALLMAHWALTMVFYVIGGLAYSAPAGVVLYAVIVVLGNLIVIALEGIVAFAQNLRLHFYEWFSKFYENGGVPFSPFKVAISLSRAGA